MKKRRLADTDIMISPVGLGTVKLGRDKGVKYPEKFAIPSDKEASKLVGLARDLGINLIDTAPAYGNSEERLGELLKNQRQDWIICTKSGEEFENGNSSFDFSVEHTHSSIHRSLQRLNTDYLDIVLVHSNGDDLDIIDRWGTLDTLAELKRAGKIRAFGMSTKTLAGGLRAAEIADVVMVTYNPLQEEDKPILDFCLAHNKAVLIKKAFAGGHIASSSTANFQSSLDFVFQHPAVSSVVLGTINPVHLEENIAAARKSLAMIFG